MKDSKILKTTILFSVFVLLAQILGLVRDLFLTRYFGVGYVLDTYYLAFKVPDFLNVFYSVFLGSVVFIPLLTQAKNKPTTPGGQGAPRPPGVVGDEEIVKVVRSIGSLVFYLVTLIGILLFIFMPYISTILAPTWSLQQQELHTSLSRILLIAQFFFPIGILAGSIGMINGRPFYMAVSGFVYNLFILLGVIIFGKIFGIYGAIGGVLVGSVAFAVVQILPKEVRKIFAKFRFEFDYISWIFFFKGNVGRFFAVLVYQLFGVLILYIATFSSSGGVSIFSISYNLYLALFFILGASLSTATMPTVSKLHVTGENLLQKENLNNSIVYMFFVGVFIALFGFIFSQDIVKILYFFSHISLEKEIAIASTFSLLILALPFFNLLEIIRKYLYSTNQIYIASTLTVFLIAGVIVCGEVLNKFFYLDILPTLSFSILFSNLISLIIALIILQNKKQIDLIYILKNTYKVVIIACLSLLLFMFADILLNALHRNYFIILFLKGIVLLTFFVTFTIILRDIIGNNILLNLRKLLSKYI